MWRCTRCETDNANADILCNGCDWHSPNLEMFEASLIEEQEIPTYLLKWKLTHTSTASIDNGIGEVSVSGETNFSIREKTELVFTGENEHAKKEFSKILLLPLPIIQNFVASHTVISLGKPISLSWRTKFADRLSITDFGEVTGSTNKEVLLRKTSSITLIAENSSGKQEKSISFLLPKPIVVEFFSNRKKSIAGDEILLSWKTINAEAQTLVGLDKDEPLKGESKKVILGETTTLRLKATNESGTDEKEIQIDVVPRPEIKLFKLSRSIALPNDRIKVIWEVISFSKLFLLIDDDILEVSDQSSFEFEADKSKEIKLVCESIEKIKSISQTLCLKVIERVSVNYFTASSLYTVRTKPVLLSWNVSNATEIILLPQKKRLESDGTISVLPSAKTIYIVEAKNELTIDRKEVEIDVLPLPSISNIRLVTPPEIKLPSFYESRIKYPVKETVTKRFAERVKNYFIDRFSINKIRSLKTTFISFNHQSEHIEIKRETSLIRIVNSIKSMAELERKIINSKKDKAK